MLFSLINFVWAIGELLFRGYQSTHIHITSIASPLYSSHLARHSQARVLALPPLLHIVYLAFNTAMLHSEVISLHSSDGWDSSLRIPTPDVNHDMEGEDEDEHRSQAPALHSDEGVSSTGKGKEKMNFTDEDFARSLYAEDGLAQFEAYLSSYPSAAVRDDSLLVEFLEQQTLANDKGILAELVEMLRPVRSDNVPEPEDFRMSMDFEEIPSEEGAFRPYTHPFPPPRWIRMNEQPSSDSDDSSKICCVCRTETTGKLIKLSCGSKYDEDCLKAMFEANVNDEFRFPPRCCGRVVPLSYVKDQISPETFEMYKAKIQEYATPSRLYCSNVHCGQFLGPRKERAAPMTCSACSTETCARCTAPSHPSSRCKVDKGVRKALKLGQSNGWQRCPRCRQLVERNKGCFHMSCRCGKQFCYLCAGEWGLCKCYKKRFFVKAIVSKWLHLRGDYLVKDEPAAKNVNPVSRAWKNVKKVVTPSGAA